MSGPALRQRIARRLAWQQRVHDPALEPRNRLSTLPMVREWQSRRLAQSFAGFLAEARTRPAAQFFLTDLYGDRDFSGRDRDVARIMPLMSRLLPESLLAAAADAIELATISHALDLRMAAALAGRARPGAPITVADYGRAYRATGHRRLRERQIELIGDVGRTLDAAVHKHGVFRLLKASRLPARAAGLSELQGFLERGFAAFGELGGADDFLDEIVAGERAASRRLFAGESDPFRGVS